jgi:hypothetical protein
LLAGARLRAERDWQAMMGGIVAAEAPRRALEVVRRRRTVCVMVDGCHRN